MFDHNNIFAEDVNMDNKKELFQYSKSTLMHWPATKKKGFNIMGKEFPGLFSTGENWNIVITILFFLTIFLEVYGFIILWNNGFRKLWAIVGIFLFDIIAAFLWHSFHNLKYIDKTNKAIVSLSNSTQEIPRFYRIHHLLVNLVGLIIIIASFTFKVYTYLKGVPTINWVQLVYIIFVYSSVAFLHIFNTGYFLKFITFSFRRLFEVRKFRKGFNEYQASNYSYHIFLSKEKYRRYDYKIHNFPEPIHSVIPLRYNKSEKNYEFDNTNESSGEVNEVLPLPTNEQIEKIENEDFLPYCFRTKGNLTDEHLSVIVQNFQGDNNILIEGLAIQLTQIDKLNVKTYI